MEKDFWTWHRLKEKLNQIDRSHVFFHEREIWFCSLGLNIGYEEDGKNENFERPVLILKKFNNYIFWGLPLTSIKKGNKYYFQIHSNTNRDNLVILSQIRLLDCKRLVRRVRTISKKDFYNLKNKFKNLL